MVRLFDLMYKVGNKNEVINNVLKRRWSLIVHLSKKKKKSNNEEKKKRRGDRENKMATISRRGRQYYSVTKCHWSLCLHYPYLSLSLPPPLSLSIYIYIYIYIWEIWNKLIENKVSYFLVRWFQIIRWIFMRHNKSCIWTVWSICFKPINPQIAFRIIISNYLLVDSSTFVLVINKHVYNIRTFLFYRIIETCRKKSLNQRQIQNNKSLRFT